MIQVETRRLRARRLSYDPTITWKVDRSQRVKAGSLAGHMNGGYLNICIASVPYRAHRLAWLIVHGRWPQADLDHANRDKADNRICNLREASRSENSMNKTAHVGSSGVRGVKWNSKNKKWVASIGKKYIGSFLDKATAQSAHQRAAAEIYGVFAQV